MNYPFPIKHLLTNQPIIIEVLKPYIYNTILLWMPRFGNEIGSEGYTLIGPMLRIQIN